MLRLLPPPVDPPPPEPVGRYFEIRSRKAAFDVWLHDGAARSNLSRSGIAPSFPNRVQAEIWARAYARDGGFPFRKLSKAKPPPTPDEIAQTTIRHERFRVDYNDRTYLDHREGRGFSGRPGYHPLRSFAVACSKLALLQPHRTQHMVLCALSRLGETERALAALRRSLEGLRLLAGPDQAKRPTLLLDWKEWAHEP